MWIVARADHDTVNEEYKYEILGYRIRGTRSYDEQVSYDMMVLQFWRKCNSFYPPEYHV